MRTKKVLAALLIVAIVGLLMLNLFQLAHRCTSLIEVNTTITVKDIGSRVLLGLNADQDMLKFGSVSPGTEARRTLYLQHPRAAEVTVTTSGELAPWLNMEPASFTLLPKTQQEIQVYASVPEDAADGDYNGEVLVCIKE